VVSGILFLAMKGRGKRERKEILISLVSQEIRLKVYIGKFRTVLLVSFISISCV